MTLLNKILVFIPIIGIFFVFTYIFKRKLNSLDDPIVFNLSALYQGWMLALVIIKLTGI